MTMATTTVELELDAISSRLLDDERIWTKDELLDWWINGYQELLSQSAAVRRFWVDDVPGRVAYAHSQEWEDRFVTGRPWFFAVHVLDGTRSATTNWEAEFVEGVTPTASLAGITQPWERSYSGDTDKAFRFVLPRESEKQARVAWDNRYLPPVAVKQLDALRSWHRLMGRPLVWTAGKGRNRTFEIYEILTDYTQAWEIRNGNFGVPRRVTGLRTYTHSFFAVANSWAYSTSGEADAFAIPNGPFNPTSAVSADWEKAYAFGAYPYRFTMLASTDSWDSPSRGYAGTQPWEIGNRGSGRVLGTYPFEKQQGENVVLNQQSNGGPKLDGLGIRFTTSDSPYYVTQAWEVEQIDGDTPDAVGAILGTFSWEVLFGATVAGPALGIVRQVTTPDRQYLGICDASTGRFVGGPREWHSMDDSITVYQSYTPAFDLDIGDMPELVSEQVMKYVRYYVLSRAFGRQGEGYRPELASHYRQRYQLGVRLMQRLLDIAYKDRDWTRQPFSTGPVRPPRVRFPSNFPTVLA